MNSALAHSSLSITSAPLTAWFHQSMDRVRTLLAHDPSVAPALSGMRAFDEAQEARAVAFSLLKTDPRMAQDIYAAADRHELAASTSH